MTQNASNIWERVISYDALHAAFIKTAANQGSSGGDGVTLQTFRHNLYANLNELRAEILQGIYRTSPYRVVTIPKKKPGYRTLFIPSIRDRILHTSIATALTPIFEPLFEDCSFAYRPGRGVKQAAERIEQWRKRGYTIVIEADIVRYFDNIDHGLLLEKIEAIIQPLDGSAPLLSLITQILNEQAKVLKTPQQGLVQGSPLSPLLSNLHLDVLDEEIEAQGVKMVRFADDFVILCKSQKKAQKALEHCIKILAEHNLRLHDEGTHIVNFQKGFDFIGYLFVRSLCLQEKKQPTNTAKKAIKSYVTDEGIIELDTGGGSI